MYKCDKYKPEVIINLEDGLYRFLSISAIGKTWLYNTLNMLRAYDENVLSYSYNDYLRGLDLKNLVQQRRIEVLMLDRYDMYKGLYRDIMEEYRKNTIVLVDCKTDSLGEHETDTCNIKLDINRIEVR